MNLNLLLKICKHNIKSKLYPIVTGSTTPHPQFNLTQTGYYIHLNILVITLLHMNPNSVKIFIQHNMYWKLKKHLKCHKWMVAHVHKSALNGVVRGVVGRPPGVVTMVTVGAFYVVDSS